MLTSDRLIIRPFIKSDLTAVHDVLCTAFNENPNQKETLSQRASWLTWSILNQEWFPKMFQPPYGERAVCRQADGVLIGLIGIVPCLDRFDQIPELALGMPTSGLTQPEIGLFFAIHPSYQQQGYATEAASRLINYIWQDLRVKRVIATTDYKNIASQSVMQKLGMRILKNPTKDPTWLQVVGVLEHPALTEFSSNSAV